VAGAFVQPAGADRRPRHEDDPLSACPCRSLLHRLIPFLMLLHGTTASAESLSREAHDVEVRRIAESYGEAMDYCRFLAGTTRNLCVVEADGARSVALAELEAAFRPSRQHSLAASLAVAEAAFTLSAARCDAGPPAEQSGCMALGRTELRSARTGADLFYGPAKGADRPARPSRHPGRKPRP